LLRGRDPRDWVSVSWIATHGCQRAMHMWASMLTKALYTGTGWNLSNPLDTAPDQGQCVLALLALGQCRSAYCWHAQQSTSALTVIGKHSNSPHVRDVHADLHLYRARLRVLRECCGASCLVQWRWSSVMRQPTHMQGVVHVRAADRINAAARGQGGAAVDARAVPTLGSGSQPTAPVHHHEHAWRVTCMHHTACMARSANVHVRMMLYAALHIEPPAQSRTKAEFVFSVAWLHPTSAPPDVPPTRF
jgi:hypothetical protein